MIPEIVSGWSDKGADDYLAVDYNRLAAIMVEAIKEEHIERIKLEKRIRKLEAKRRRS